MRLGRAGERRMLVPEVVQSSAMDCGPASLKCLLEGFGIPVSYGRLREACQTDVDGTSIDTIEEVAIQLGLDAEQIMMPADHLLVPEARALPALLVVRLASGVTHFLVTWRRHGPLVQLMDPGTGRRWTTVRRLLSEVYIHEHPVPAEAWREWAGSEEFAGVVRGRLAGLGLERRDAARRIGDALEDPSWRSIAALDASTRMIESIVRARGLNRGREAGAALERSFASARDPEPDGGFTIPSMYWSVRARPPAGNGGLPQDDGVLQDGGVQPPEESPPPPSGSSALQDSGEEELILRGAVLVRVRQRRPAHQAVAESTESIASTEPAPEREPLSPELVAALEEPSVRPERHLLALLRADGAGAPLSIIAALLLAAGSLALEALLFRGLIDIGRDLGLSGQRLQAMGALLLFALALLLLELPVAFGLLGFGRRLEARLRVAFLRRIPRLSDRYLHSRLTSDMAERSHSLHRIRLLPDLCGHFLRSFFQLILTTAGIIWLDPTSAILAIPIALLAVGIPLAAQPILGERDLRVRSHAGALSRFYLDALLGLIPIRAHGAERAVRREHEKLLIEWAHSGVVLQRAAVLVEALQLLMGFGLVWFLVSHLAQRGEPGSLLLVVYWALSLPMLGENIAMLARQYPDLRNLVLRMLEPLGAPDEAEMLGHADRSTVRDDPRLPGVAAPHDPACCGLAIEMEAVCVRASGHSVLEDIDLRVAPGCHVAIVGSSGAGKSSLVGLLLGWHRPASGRVLADGTLLDGPAIQRLRRETAWVDPAVQLWNRTLLENLRYGSPDDADQAIAFLVEAAELRSLLVALPDGLQTPLGEGGALVSGGEGQRIRLARAMLRRDMRLVILDEPFRGLDRDRRHRLLVRARELWKSATLLCITHDVGETADFERVVVIEGGRIVEDDAPDVLAADPETRYSRLLAAERNNREGLWGGVGWRRLTLSHGQLAASGNGRAP